MEEQNKPVSRSIELCRRVVTTESFIAEAKEIYGDQYDYSKVKYINGDHRVTVVCHVHGDFMIYAREHLDGRRCPKCEKGEKFIKKLQDKFGDKFGLEQFVYESSTSPVTLICPTHGAFSRLPHTILQSPFGCPECANKVKEDARQAKKEAIKEEKRRAREEYETQRLNGWLQEREERKKKRDRALKAFLSGRREYICFNIYRESVDEHIEGVRYGSWKTEYYQQYRLSDDEARKLKCFKEGDKFYRFQNEAPKEYFIEAFKSEWSRSNFTIEQFLSHRSCIIHFDGDDLIIQEDMSQVSPNNIVSTSATSNVYSDLPTSFVAIDCETLYSQRLSVCSIGMVKYKDGKIVDRYYSLVRPPFDYKGKSGKALTWVHGITEDMLVNEKTFEELLPEIEKFAGKLPLVAHNASVEKCCIRDACAYYDIKTKLDYNNIIDTLPLSKAAEAKTGKIIEGQGTHTIDAVCERFGIDNSNHHNALSDAEMAGNLMVVFQNILAGEKTANNNESKGGCLGTVIIFLMMFLTTFISVSCNKSVDYGPDGQRACDYVEDMTVRSGFEVKNVEITSCDTILSYEFLEDIDFTFRMNYEKFKGREISDEEYKEYLLNYIKDTYEIRPFMLATLCTDSLRKTNKYDGFYRKLYTVRVESTSKMNPTEIVRIMIDRYGNPKTEEDALKVAERYREIAEMIYTTIF